jgi:hypothetical protein
MLMRRTIFVLLTILVVFAAVFAGLVVYPVRTVKAHHGCSNRTLFGDYGMTVSGQEQGPTGGPVTMVALVHFDGIGGLSGTETYKIVGFNFSGTAGSFTGASYEVLSDCSVTLTIGGISAQGVVVDANGREVIGEVFSPSTTTSPIPPNAGMGIFNVKKVSDFD